MDTTKFPEKSEIAKWVNRDRNARLEMLERAIVEQCKMKPHAIKADEKHGLAVQVISESLSGVVKRPVRLGEMIFSVAIEYQYGVAGGDESSSAGEPGVIQSELRTPSGELFVRFLWKKLHEYAYEAEVLGFVLKAAKVAGKWQAAVARVDGDERSGQVLCERSTDSSAAAMRRAELLLRGILEPARKTEEDRLRSKVLEILREAERLHRLELEDEEKSVDRDHVMTHDGAAVAIHEIAEAIRRLGVSDRAKSALLSVLDGSDRSEGATSGSSMVRFSCVECAESAVYPRVSSATPMPSVAAEKDGWSFARQPMGPAHPRCPECTQKRQSNSSE